VGVVKAKISFYLSVFCYNLYIILIKFNMSIREEKIEKTYKDDVLIEAKYWINNRLSRVDGPAYKLWDNNGVLIEERYYLDGLLHNENGPAVRFFRASGSPVKEIFYKNHKLHNESGAAYKEWGVNGRLIKKEYYLNGVNITKEYKEKTKLDKQLKNSYVSKKVKVKVKI
jgi:hypothetical protein